MKNCEEYAVWISAFIDGELPEAEQRELMEHMAACLACHQYFDDQIAIHDALTALETEIPEDFAASIMARVRETAQEKPQTEEKKLLTFPHWRRWAALAACFALVLLGLWTTRDGMGVQYGAARSVTQNAAPQIQSESADAEVGAQTAESTDAAVGVSLQTATAEPDEKPDEKSLDGGAEIDAAENNEAQDVAEAEKAIQYTETLTTGSDLAARWVEEALGKPWSSGCGYELTAEQFDELRTLLDEAGESYSLEPSEEEARWYLVLAE